MHLGTVAIGGGLKGIDVQKRGWRNSEFLPNLLSLHDISGLRNMYKIFGNGDVFNCCENL